VVTSRGKAATKSTAYWKDKYDQEHGYAVNLKNKLSIQKSLTALKSGQRTLGSGQDQLKAGQKTLDSGQTDLKKGQNHLNQEQKRWFWQKNRAEKPDHLQ